MIVKVLDDTWKEKVYRLRNDVLRVPLGLNLYDEDLDAERDEIFIGAIEGDELIGTLQLKEIDNITYKMRQVAVLPNLQRSGIGKAMVEFSEKFAYQKGKEKIILHARDVSVPFYTSLQYKIISDEFLEVGIPHYKMEKNIDPRQIKIEHYNYILPESRIAEYPVDPKDESKLLVYDHGKISTDRFKSLAEYLPEDSLLISNNSKVVPARIHIPVQEKIIEIFLLEPIAPAQYENNFNARGSVCWKCFIGNYKKWKSEVLTYHDIQFKVLNRDEDAFIVEIKWEQQITFAEVLHAIGKIPIPPYIKRELEPSDLSKYQTLMAVHNGSVAAPTAGLHFTENVFASLQEKNITHEQITLHVGAGTFKPVNSEHIGGHAMHKEQYVVTRNLLKTLSEANTITVTGTTSLRTLESLYWLGYKIIKGLPIADYHISQWEVYDYDWDISRSEAFAALYNALDSDLEASTQIIITPLYKIKSADYLITNFHQPKSTLLLLVASAIGKDWEKVYEYAMDNDYRFLSYGDASLLKINS